MKRRFKIAWAILPDAIQNDLKPFIKDIRMVSSLIGTQIRHTNGEVTTSEKDGSGWCVPDPQGKCVYIRLHQDLQDIDEFATVYVMLHEIAHALEFLQDDEWRIDIRSEARSEFAADMQVAAWAARNAYRAYDGGYKYAKEIAALAIDHAKNHLLAW